MPNLFLLINLILVSTYSDLGLSRLIVPDNVRIDLNDSTKMRFLENLNSFLNLKDADLGHSDLIDSANYFNYKIIFDELKYIELSASLSDSNYYKPYLINFVKHDNAEFIITISFRGMYEDLIEEKARVTLLMKNENGSFKFLNPFEYYNNVWSVQKISNVYFHYRGSIDSSEAGSFARHNEYMASIFGKTSYPIKYYKCRDLQEVYKFFGIDYHIKLNGMKRGCVTIPHLNLFVSGTNKDEYNHDLSHYYFGLYIPEKSRNWVAEEGFNINLTDYWAYSANDNYSFLKEYLSNQDVTPLEIFLDNRIMNYPIPTKMPVAGLIMRKIERENGMPAVLDVISAGKTDDDFFEAISRIAQITKENFNETVETELYRN